MKNIVAFFTIAGVLVIQTAFAQTDTHLTLSGQYPAAGQKITVTYDPSGTPLDGKKDINAVVYYLDNKDYPAADIDLKPSGKFLTGEISIPATAMAFFIKISSDDVVDNNNDKGYVYMVYQDKQPVPGAYFSKGYMIATGMGTRFAKIKKDDQAGMDLMKKEFEVYPQSQKEYQAGYYMVLARMPVNKPMVIEKTIALEKSTDEKDLMLAASLLRQTKNLKSSDSLNAVIRVKFPDGTLVKNEVETAFYNETDVTKRDSIYHVYIKKYPENAADKNSIQDNFRLELASHYLYNRDMDNYHKYLVQVKNKSGLAGYYNNDAYDWAKKGDHLDEAENLSKQSLELVSERINNPVGVPYHSPAQMKKSALYSYDLYADTYAYILYKENKFEEALKYEQPVIDHSTTIDPDVYGNYIQILAALGQDAKAKEAAEKAVKNLQGSAAIKEALKKIYIKEKGNDAGYDQYIASLENDSKNKAKVELAKTMINKPAPVFALKDIDGNVVSLKDLKGKIVIVDFWATWCGPCKASFPGMQMAVDKYKDDPNVKFLFVDTWENGDRYLDGAKKFITDNKYTFHVLMDEKGDDGRQSKTVTAYGVNGIPTKFIIDKNGNIRFMYVGYDGTPEKLVDEVTNMVDLASNPTANVSTEKESVNK